MSQQNIYDNETFFENFKSLRASDVNYNDCIETPMLLSMLPDLRGKHVLDIGCGMGQHAKQYAGMGAALVLGIDISTKMLDWARSHNAAPTIVYQRLPMEELDQLEDAFDVVTSSLVFDYVEDFDRMMRLVYDRMKLGAYFVFSTSHPMATAWDGTYPRFTRSETGQRLYANINNYMVEGKRSVKWVVEDYELYHRTFASLVNAIVHAGFQLEECQESNCSDALRAQYPSRFDGTIHRPDFVFFRCRKLLE